MKTLLVFICSFFLGKYESIGYCSTCGEFDLLESKAYGESCADCREEL